MLRLATVQSRLPELEELTFTQALKDYQRQREAFGDARIFINSIPNPVSYTHLMKLKISSSWK